MRLIDADAIDWNKISKRNEIYYRNTYESGIVASKHLIEKQPTAYDVDKVVERLEEKQVEFKNIILDIVIDALKKQIPEKPHKYIAFDGIERNGCPNCFRGRKANEILYAGQKYCSVCGQKLDRSGE